MASHAPEPGVRPLDDGLAARLRNAEAQLALARAQLLEAEQTNAEVGELREGLRAATDDLGELRRALELSRAQNAHLERLRADLEGSLSWRVTRPLRAAKRATRGG